MTEKNSIVRPGRKPGFLVFTIAAGWLALFATARAEQSVTLAWNPGTDANVVGYRVYTREENKTTPVSTNNVGGLTQVKLSGLKEGLRYTFTVKSYNALGAENPSSADTSVSERALSSR